jgi:hypothetical protein
MGIEKKKEKVEKGRRWNEDVLIKSPNLPLSPIKQTPILSALSAVGSA